jgi:hypothetical protein
MMQSHKGASIKLLGQCKTKTNFMKYSQVGIQQGFILISRYAAWALCKINNKEIGEAGEMKV